MLSRKPLPILALLSLCALTAGCAFEPGLYNIDRGPANTYPGTAAPAVPTPAPRNTTRAFIRNRGNPLHAQAPLTSEQVASRDRNCGPFGVPAVAADAGWGETEFAGRWGYFLQHSAEYKLPLWVCEYVERSQIDDPLNVNRPGWKADPQLTPGKRAEFLPDYDVPTAEADGLYDCGHLCPNADFDTKPRRDETFYLSNVVPQIKGNNRQIWSTLEGRVRSWIMVRGEAYIITGPLYFDPRDDPTEPGYNANEDDDTVYPPGWIGAAEDIPVPTHIYKIVLAPRPGQPDQWESIAVVLENRGYPSPYPYGANLRSIDWIEQRTGINFFPALDSDPTLEQRLEGQPAPAFWTGVP